MAELRDSHGRVARDLRVSLTDRCNLRCTYCMPAVGPEWLPSENTLRLDEIQRLLRLAVEQLGVSKLRFTGGEPLLRRDLEEIVQYASALHTREGQRPDLALTTNGLGLDKRLNGLREAGLRRVNISLDTLDRQTYANLTRRDRLPDVLTSIDAVAEAGLTPLKINSVIMRGTNEDAVMPLAEFCLARGYQLRFIEQMPLGPRHTWDRSRMVTGDEILTVLKEKYTLSPSPQQDNSPASLWDVTSGGLRPGGQIGVIASVTAPFCTDCDRTRITSDGQVRSCLFSHREADLRTIMRQGGTDADIVTAWTGEHRQKPAEHGVDGEDFAPPDRTMSAIGG